MGYVAVSYVAISTLAGGATTGTPTVPAGIQAGDRIYLVIVNKPSTTTPTTDVAWTSVVSFAGGTGTDGAGTGLVRCTVYRRDYDGVWTMPTVTNSGTGAGMAFYTVAFRPAAGESFIAETSTGGQDTTIGTAWSITGSSGINLDVDDIVLALGGTSAINTASAGTISATGATFGTFTKRADSGTGSGNDAGIKVYTGPVTAGSSNVAPVYGMTLTTADSGAGVLVRVRSVVVPVAPPPSPAAARYQHLLVR